MKNSCVRSCVLSAMLAAVLGIWTDTGRSEGYPSKPIKIVVPVAPGGLIDILPRILAQKLGESGYTIVVENRPGAGGMMAAEDVAKSSPDGYTLMMGFHATNAILPHLSSRLGFDPERDFVPIIHLLSVPNVLVINPSVPVKSVQELIAYGKANPGRLSYGSSGIGSLSHIAGEQLRALTGIDLVHVPYKGPTLAVQDVVAGHVSMMFDAVPLALEPLRSGKTRALAVTARQRIAPLKDVPTMAEAGLPDLEGGIWFGLVAPAGTPPAIIAWLNQEANKTFGRAEVREPFLKQGASMPLGTPEAFGQFMAAESRRFGAVIRRAGIKLD